MGYYLFAHTQDVENYGAHDWDGEGTCPQYWKYKGGVTLAIPLTGAELTGRDANYAARCLDELRKAQFLENDGVYFKTYYVGHEVVDADDLFIGDEPDYDLDTEFVGLVRFPDERGTKCVWKLVPKRRA